MKRKMLLMLSILLIFSSLCPVVSAAELAPVRIAVIDTGIREEHPMLDSSKIAQGNNYAFPGEGTDDLIGHGTRIAGLILGSSNGTLTGMAPDAVLVPLVYYSRYPSGVSKNGGVEAICQAIYDAVDQYDCQVINISSGVADPDDQLYEAVCYAEEKGVVVVSAVGNDNLTYPTRLYYPAAYETVVGVGAANTALTGAAGFSQRSSGVKLLAPGESLSVLSIKSGENFETVSGTSYAAAQVTGLAAQLKARYPDMKPIDFRQILSHSCSDRESPGYDAVAGWGLLNPDAALMAAADQAAGVLLHYDDVSYADWFCGSVRFVHDKALMKGIGNQSFNPYGRMTRGMAATILWRIAGSPAAGNGSDTPVFSDVPDGAWYADAVLWAADTGIAEGVGDGQFAPDGRITREQMATILYRYAIQTESSAPDALSKDKEPLLYEDADEVSIWATEAMCWASAHGLIRGMDGNMLRPEEDLTRAQLATILERFLSV